MPDSRPPPQEDWRAGGFGLYVHWPFCAAKCPYCDFNSHVVDAVDQSRWARALSAEIARLAEELPGRHLSSIFFGGGTPSLMAPETVDAVLRAARAAWGFANDIEITLEANPTSVEMGRFRGFAEAGVNRLSMGVQSLRDEDLRRLGRMHSASEARAAFDVARAVFDRVSFDLIYARQGQERSSWRAELGEALGNGRGSPLPLPVDHRARHGVRTPGRAGPASRSARRRPCRRHVSDTQELCDAAGLPIYEISNHARAGAESRHNLIYWRQGDWAAVGPGAHGRMTLLSGRVATEAHRTPGAWLDAVERIGTGESLRTFVPQDEQGTEYLLMGMRLVEGIDESRLAALTGRRLDAKALVQLEELGMVHRHDGRLSATAAGRPVLNAILRELAA